MHVIPIREHRVHRPDIVHHLAVTDGSRPATVVGRHAANGRPAAGGDINGKEQPVRIEQSIELVEHNSGLHHRPSCFRIHRNEAVEVFADINDDAFTNRLPALRGAATPHRHRNACVVGDAEGRQHVLLGFWHHHAQRFDLIDRSIGAVKPPRKVVKEHLSGSFPQKALGN